MAHSICELLWLNNIMTKLGFLMQGLMNLYCDNKVAMNIAHNPVQHHRTKHVKVDRKFENICMPFVKIKDHMADISTKGLSSVRCSSIVIKLGMWDLYSPT